ncbi:MAG: ABC transporter ATP-binding protein [Clostridia bacterium]|nr:ABC transporter ATP-binding protein [Clostridia bacterium]
MAKRTLESLQKQYAREVRAQRGGPGMGRPGGPGRRNPAMKGKPKNTRATVARLWRYVSAYRWLLLVVLFCMLLQTVASLCGSFLLNPIINRIAGTETTVANSGLLAVTADNIIETLSSLPIIRNLVQAGTLGALTFYLVTALCILGCIYLVGILCTYLQARIMLHVSQSATEKIRNDLFAKLQTLPIRYFDTNTTGETMSRFTNDVDNIDIMMNNSLTSLVSGVITLIGTFTFMITTNFFLTLITVCFIPLFMFLGGAIGKRSSKFYSGQQAALGAVNGYIEETVTGQKVVKVFNHEETCVEEFAMLNDDLRKKQLNAQFFGGIMGPIMGNTSQISYAITVGVGGILMCTTGFTPGALTIFADYSRKFSMPINMISNQMSTIFAALAGAERVFGIMDQEPEAADATSSTDAMHVRGDVVLTDVDFGYVPEKQILHKISLYAHPGQKIAFVGSTGAGKTTITNLLNRFYDVDAGTITVDGVDIRNLPRSFLRENVAMVLQDTHLFTGTVRENIRYGRLDATDEEVEEAAKTASAYSFIMRLDKGFDTVITGDGANLSQGQRQLLNIARAALSKAPILVLDEATSSVDTRTERHIEHGLARLMKDRTTFVIAHRLSTVRNADAIMVLENGTIIERGTHDQLLELKGRYYELYTDKRELA